MDNRPRLAGGLLVVAMLGACGSTKHHPIAEDAGPGLSNRVETTQRPLVSAPRPPALLVVHSTTLTAGDSALQSRLASNLGFALTVVADAAAVAANLSGQ
jgi:hypothetical protein